VECRDKQAKGLGDELNDRKIDMVADGPQLALAPKLPCSAPYIATMVLSIASSRDQLAKIYSCVNCADKFNHSHFDLGK
jgi:hypothetical protein